MKKRPLPPHTKLHSKKSELVFKGVRFDTYQWQQKQFDGSTATFEVVKRDDTVVIIPVIDGKIVVVNEQQPHWDKPGCALAAGMVHPEEDLDIAARRELEEETGLMFENYHLVHIGSNAPGVEWFTYTFIATGYKGSKEKHLDPGEKNEVMKLSLEKVLEMTKKREFLYPMRFIDELILRGTIDLLPNILKNPEKYSIPL